MKRNNRLFIVVITTCLALLLGSCDRGFGEINTNPNIPSQGTSDLILISVLRSTVFGQFSLGNSSGLARHVVHTNYNEIEQYAFDDNQGSWDNYYSLIKNTNEIIRLAEQEGNKGNVAKGYVLKAFIASQLTDLWGDVPYFEANSGTLTPKYDSQKDIYTSKGGIIDLLEQADLLLSNASQLSSDILYKGDLMKWRKLSNSLRLRYLLRISKRVGDSGDLDIAKEIRKVAVLPLMESNADNAELKYLSTFPNMCPFYEMREGSYETFRMSSELEDIYNKYHDPRIEVWFFPTTTSKSSSKYEYKGVPAGLSSTSLKEIGYSASDVSMIGGYYRSTPNAASAILMTVSEVKFLLAEAAARGFIPATDLERNYIQGISLSIEYYCGNPQLVSNYLNQNGVKFDPKRGIEQIMVQKWLASFGIGYEAWFDFLRTGYPNFAPLKDNRNPSKSGEIPYRYYYPEKEQTLNADHYLSAIKLTGKDKDDVNTPLWWAKK